MQRLPTLSASFALATLWATNVIAAPDILDSLNIDRPSDDKLLLPSPVQKKKPPIIDLPPLAPRQTENPSIKDLLNFVARKFRFEGNTVFSDKELAGLIDKFRITPINALDLEELRLIITNHYVNHGYINSGALLPDQNLLGGLLIIEITEGVLQEIRVENDGRLKPDYIKDRLRFRNDEPLHLGKLQSKLQLLQQDPRIERINAALLPGDKRGTSILDIKITEAKSYAIDFEVNNHRPPSIDETQSILSLKHYNISGIGDSIDAAVHYTTGLRHGSVEYNYPLTHYDTKVYFGATHSDTAITEELFKNFTFRGYSVKTGIKSPLLLKKNERYDVDLKFEYKSNITRPLNPESCTLGDADQPSNIAAVRLGQSFLNKFDNEILSLRHTISTGINAFNATRCGGNIADSRFSSWLWQVLWAHKFTRYKIQTVVRGDVQISLDPLLSAEKFSLGGANSVRGFRENLLVRDNGRFFSIEARLPLRTTMLPKLEMQAMLFADYGEGWNENRETLRTISSLGIGYRWHYQHQFLAELFWAKQLEGDVDLNDGLQDDGIHAKLLLELF